MKTIEQLEQEKADILAKAIAVAAELRRIGGKVGMQPDKWELVESIEALKPKPERLRLWVNFYERRSLGYAYPSKKLAEGPIPNEICVRTAVPMIEVIPFEGEVPTWEEWGGWGTNPRGIFHGKRSVHLANADDQEQVSRVIDTHNAEMRRAFDFIAKLLAERGEG